jgi:hypothetical protein
MPEVCGSSYAEGDLGYLIDSLLPSKRRTLHHHRHVMTAPVAERFTFPPAQQDGSYP